MSRVRAELPAYAALTVLWLLILATLGLGGDFPISDDWAYAYSTRTLLETGSFERVAWTWAPIVSNVAIGSFFSLVFGFSFETLRASTVFMGWVGVLGTYSLSRQLGAAPAWSLLGALLLALNPLYLVLSYTYMTDVAFAALCTWSLVFLSRGLPSLDWRWLGAGSVLAVGAILSRQVGLAIPVALAATAAMVFAKKPAPLVLLLSSAAVVGAVFWAMPDLIFGSGDAGSMFTLETYVWKMLPFRSALHRIILNSTTGLLYLGLFLAPVALVFLPDRGRSRQILVISSLAFAGLLLLGLWKVGLRMPLTIDWIHDYGLGPLNLSGSRDLPPVPSGFWWGVTLASCAGGSLVLGRLALEAWERRRIWRQQPDWLILVAFVAVYLGVFLVRRPYFDRYLIAPLPPLISLLLVPLGRRRGCGRGALALCLLLTLALGAAAVGGTRDLLVHHAARWSLLNELLEAGISPERIDGGAEFGGLYNFHVDYTPFKKLDDPPRPWVVDDAYVVSFRDRLSGYRPIASREYRRLLPPRVERITVHRRNEETPAGGFAAPSP